jgi:ATP-dependent RNA helicase RhlE
VSEDYVHRIGRTGRAGREGHAVSLVCMDEEGFMMDIERFTKQEIPVQVLEGFGPEEGEVAEPIAMGRQTIWGGAGKPPSRDVMQAAAKAARQEMMDRIRTTKAAQPDRGRAGGRGQAPKAGSDEGRPEGGNGGQGRGRNHAGAGAGSKPRRDRFDGGNGQGAPAHRPKAAPQGQQAHRRGPRPDGEGGSRRFDDQPPRADAHLGTQLGHVRNGGPRGGAGGGQPDPMRTSVDTMAERGRRGGFNRGGNGGGGGGFGGGGRGGSSRGGYGR